jgi:hypothetical protein
MVIKAPPGGASPPKLEKSTLYKKPSSFCPGKRGYFLDLFSIRIDAFACLIFM